MSCNPCCCWKLKDAAVTIGIWSAIYALASLAMFTWQWGVLSQCQHVTMAQSNLQCEYYCPCVGASTARTSVIVEAFQAKSKIIIATQVTMSIYGWQTAAIKYEKDRAANTLLPNYNTYGRYDIPSYYESYWQSPEERYYIGLFVIQILCLIASFFLLFASIMLIYGVHVWSRYLVWPWFICMASSILTSLAYCIMWWAGDVRDYWLVLTIIEAFSIFLNCYCFVVIAVFYNRMSVELNYYEGRRAQKYNRFNPREISLQTEQDFVDDDCYPFENVGGPAGYPKYPPVDPLPPYRPPAQAFYPPAATAAPGDYRPSPLPQKFEPIGISDSQQQRTNLLNQDRDTPRSAMIGAQSVPSLLDDFRDVSRQEHRRSQRHRSCHCDSHHCHRRRCTSHDHRSRHRHGGGGGGSGCHRRSHCHNGDGCRRRHSSKSHYNHHDHHGDSGAGGLDACSSDICSAADASGTDSLASSRCHYQNAATLKRRRREQTRGSFRNLSRLSDANESDEEFEARRKQSTLPRTGDSMRRHKSVPSDVRKRRTIDRVITDDTILNETQRRESIMPGPLDSLFDTGTAGPGFTIPQHIVIPPSTGGSTDGGERKYQINSEITISYDPRRQRYMAKEPPTSGGSQRAGSAPIPPPRTPQVRV